MAKTKVLSLNALYSGHHPLPPFSLPPTAWRKSPHKSCECLPSLREEGALSPHFTYFTYGAVGQISDAAYKIIKQPGG